MAEKIDIPALGKNPTKEEIIARLRQIKALGWISGRRPGNAGSVGNTLEDYMGIQENNIATADAGEWEIKSQRADTTSLITLFHFEPEPRADGIVSKILLPKYGWPHASIPKEMSFRATLNGRDYTDRGFKVVVNEQEKKVFITFSKDNVAGKHHIWLKGILDKIGPGEIMPQPFWSFAALEKKITGKIKNAFFIIAKTRTINGKEEFCYDTVYMLSGFDFDKFLSCLRTGTILIDFDARTGHNHGTKFRIKQDSWPFLFDFCNKIA